MKLPMVIRDFEGGWSTDIKVGIKNSFAYSQSVDFRKSPSQLTILPTTRREDNGVVKDLIQNEIITQDGTIYGIGSLGWFYKRTTGGTWSAQTQLSPGTFGIDYRQDLDSIYICHAKTVSLYTPVSSNPGMNPNYYGISQSSYNNSATAGFNVNTNQSGSTLTTAIPIDFNENSTNLRWFQDDIEPLNKISVYVVAKGTGDWTLTLHNGLNQVLGTVTVSNGSLINGQFNDFVFSAPVRLSIAATNTTGQGNTSGAQTYHLHLTSTVADGTVASSALNNLSTSDLQIWADRLVNSPNGLHPMTNFLQYECIGNERYLSVWEPLGDPIPDNTEWQRHRLVFPPGYQVCGLAVFNEYLAIACEKFNNNNDPQKGIIFFWDGLSSTFNYYTKIPEGSPQAIHEYKNVIYYYAGGDWYAIASPRSLPVKIRKMPNTDSEFSGTNDTTRIYPYAATVRRGIHLMAFPSTTTNTAIQYGAYSWGSVDKNFPDSFGYSYLMSTGSQTYSNSNNLTIGMVQNFGNILHMSWRDDLNGGYGIDVIDNTSNPAPFATWESPAFDNGYPSKSKKAIYMETSFLDIPIGATVNMKYRLGRGDWVNDTIFYSSTTKWKSYNQRARFNIDEPSLFGEIQIGVDLTATTLTPTITSVMLLFDDNRNETLGE